MDNILDPVSSSIINSFSSGPTFAQPDLVSEFKIDIPQAQIDSIMARVMMTKLPKQMPMALGEESKWETGADMDWMEELRMHWVQKFNWKKAQERLNSFPQYMAQVDGYDIHFYYIKGEGDNPLPLILSHGSPGSVVEFLDCIPLLTEPSKHGGKVEDAFTLIIPSLPGFGFSSMPKEPIHAITTARLWHKLVKEIIGHEHYAAQGGDVGAVISLYLACLYPESLKAIHMNFPIWFSVPDSELTENEKKWIKEYEAYLAGENFDSLRLLMNKPMMISVALNDSPMGTAAWIAEKFWSWCDHGGKLESVISKDDLLTNIMLYLVSEGGVAASFWYFRAYRTELNWRLHPEFIKTPTAIAIYPKEHLMGRPTLQMARRGYNVIHYAEIPRGGHFAAMEQPELFSSDLRESMRDFH